MNSRADDQVRRKKFWGNESRRLIKGLNEKVVTETSRDWLGITKQLGKKTWKVADELTIKIIKLKGF